MNVNRYINREGIVYGGDVIDIKIIENCTVL